MSGVKPRRRFRERAQRLFPDRYVSARTSPYDGPDFSGENALVASATAHPGDRTLHADPDCHHVPDGAVVVYPESHAERCVGRWACPDKCDYCCADSLGDS